VGFENSDTSNQADNPMAWLDGLDIPLAHYRADLFRFSGTPIFERLHADRTHVAAPTGMKLATPSTDVTPGQSRRHDHRTQRLRPWPEPLIRAFPGHLPAGVARVGAHDVLLAGAVGISPLTSRNAVPEASATMCGGDISELGPVGRVRRVSRIFRCRILLCLAR
jgi:hypothetical protein